MVQQRFHRNTAWFLVALFLLSAGHGIVFHAGHDHHGVREDCALCVLSWTVAIASAAVLAATRPQHSSWPIRGYHVLPSFALVYSSGQRAPPSLLQS